ncbi:MAG TPA: TonB-dependent receptor [Terriglobales bacterium]|nr:TonB-dependent receptor [Terriglobales bacterium]
MKVWMSRLAIVIVSLACAVGLFAQATGSITGTVTDKSGAVIPGATVTVTNAAQGVTRTTTTNAEGSYLVGGLSAGTYDVTVVAKGFNKSVTTGIPLHIGENLRADATLQVGQVENEVTVSGTSVGQVQLQSAALAGTITGTEVQQLELNGRNFTQLITLTPGVSNQTGQDEGTVGVYGNVAYSVNGGRTEYNNWEVDGANVMDNGSNATINVYPSIDAISHVRVLTSNYGAQYGRDASGTVEADTKSGTNQWHGDAYEYLRNEALNSRSFFDTARPPYRKNDYGYTVGGPIVKNKTFFFWSEEWRKEKNPSTFNMLVPSVAERQGNFSDVCPAAVGGTQTGYNEFRTANPDCPVTVGPPPAGSTDPTYTMFPGNTVPIDPNGQALLALIPAPNVAGSANALETSISEPTNWREEMFRVDQTFNSKWSAYFRFIHDSWNTVVVPTLWGSGNLPNVQTAFTGPGVDMVAHLATTISPTLLNEFVADYTADHIGLIDSGPIALASGFTMPGLFANGFGGKMPSINLCCNAADNGGGGLATDTGDEPWFNSNPTYSYRDQVTQVIGNHNLFYGFQFTAAQKNEMGGQELQPSLAFSNTAPISTGNALADLMMGNIASISQSNLQPKYFDRYKTAAPYIQDDWHVNPRLTLNLGLRLDLLGTYYDDNPTLEYNFEPSAWVAANAPTINAAGNVSQPSQSGGVANFFNGLVQCDTNGAPRGCIKGHLMNWAPRFGFAYDVTGDGKTALRGGYGIFYDHTNGNEAIDQLRNPPAALTSTIPNITGYANVPSGGAAQFGPLGVGAIPLQEQWPYVQQWNLDLQRQVMNTAVTVAYVGSKGTHLTDNRDLNQLHPTPLSQDPYSAQRRPDLGGRLQQPQ